MFFPARISLTSLFCRQSKEISLQLSARLGQILQAGDDEFFDDLESDLSSSPLISRQADDPMPPGVTLPVPLIHPTVYTLELAIPRTSHPSNYPSINVSTFFFNYPSVYLSYFFSSCATLNPLALSVCHVERNRSKTSTKVAEELEEMDALIFGEDMDDNTLGLVVSAVIEEHVAKTGGGTSVL
jgi:hypothetical protein